MDDVTLVGIDLGKHSFHLHGQDAKGKAVFRKKMSRKQLIEFCLLAAQYDGLAATIAALRIPLDYPGDQP